MKIGTWSSATLAAAVAGLALAAPAAAQAPDLDCSDFATQGEAQAQLEKDPTDPHGLDADGDGIACESLPAGGAPAEDDGDDSGQPPAGQLPETGISAGPLVAAGAAGSLGLLGAGLWLVARRRRVSFTA